MKVFVLNKNGNPLMPTTPRKARVLLFNHRADIVKYVPFTIKLKYGSGGHKQDITLGVDSGFENIGLSCVSKEDELFSCDVSLLRGISKRMTKRKIYRAKRRRDLRYREPGVNNRTRYKIDGWLAPSTQHKIDSHIKLINLAKSILPITKTIVESGCFDIKKIKNNKSNYKQSGYDNKLQFLNLKEYVKRRDGYKCQNKDCKNKSKTLVIHHIGFWKGDKSNRPGNLITLCTKCHAAKNHLKGGFLYGFEPHIKSFRAETFMGILRKRIFENIDAEETFGYITKSRRVNQGIEKTHHNDAFVIAGGDGQRRSGTFFLRQKRKNNRSLEKFYDSRIIDTRTGDASRGQLLSSNRASRNKELYRWEENLRKYRGEKIKKGFRAIRRKRYKIQPHDVVMFEGKTYKAVASQNKGTQVRITDGFKSIVRSVEKIKVIYHSKTLFAV